MPDLQTSITTISDDQLDALFGDEPLKEVNADTVQLGKNPEEKNIKVGREENITQIGEEELTNLFNEEIPDDKPKDVQKESEQKKDDKKDEKQITELKEEKGTSITEVLANTAKFLIEKGLWTDMENRDEILSSLTEDEYADLALQQQQFLIEKGHQERIERTGDYGKAIFDYIENGGNPDEVIDVFKEQKDVQSIPITEQSGQKELVEKYYTDVVGWNLEKTKKFVNQLITNDELESEAQEAKGKYQEFFKKQVENLQYQQQVAKKAEIERQQQFVKTLNNTLQSRKDFTDKDKKLIQESVFRYDSVLEDGTKVNKFYLKFAEMQKDPDTYLDLVNFVMDKESYDKKAKTKENNKSVEKKWQFVKQGNAITKSTGSSHDTPIHDKSKVRDLDFSGVRTAYN